MGAARSSGILLGSRKLIWDLQQIPHFESHANIPGSTWHEISHFANQHLAPGEFCLPEVTLSPTGETQSIFSSPMLLLALADGPKQT